MAAWLGTASPTDFKPYDLLHGSNLSDAGADDFALSWHAGVFSGFVNRLSPVAGLDPVEVALRKLQVEIASSQVADDVVPYLIRGMYDYTELVPFGVLNDKTGFEWQMVTGVTGGATPPG
jgi:hypothetical protein